MSYDAGQISDILELRQLAYRYAQGVDGRDAEALGDLFTEDCLVDGSGYYSRGRKGITAIPAMLDRRFEGTYHAVQNHIVHLNGDTAEGEVYAISRHLRKAPDDSLTVYVMYMRYRDKYVRQADGWRFAHRHILLDWTETGPAERPPAPRPDRG